MPLNGAIGAIICTGAGDESDERQAQHLDERAVERGDAAEKKKGVVKKQEKQEKQRMASETEREACRKTANGSGAQPAAKRLPWLGTPLCAQSRCSVEAGGPSRAHRSTQYWPMDCWPAGKTHESEWVSPTRGGGHGKAEDARGERGEGRGEKGREGERRQTKKDEGRKERRVRGRQGRPSCSYRRPAHGRSLPLPPLSQSGSSRPIEVAATRPDRQTPQALAILRIAAALTPCCTAPRARAGVLARARTRPCLCSRHLALPLCLYTWPWPGTSTGQLGGGLGDGGLGRRLGTDEGCAQSGRGPGQCVRIGGLVGHSTLFGSAVKPGGGDCDAVRRGSQAVG